MTSACRYLFAVALLCSTVLDVYADSAGDGGEEEVREPASLENPTTRSTVIPVAPRWVSRVFGSSFSLRDGVRRFSFAEPTTTLRNPRGFDLPTSVFQTGESVDIESSGGYTNIAIENPLAPDSIKHRVWEIHYDRENYNGLSLTNVLLGTGFALTPRLLGSVRGRVAAGLAGGVTFSESFFDSALHPAVDAWLSIGLIIKVVTIDVAMRERKAFAQTLDERSASPRTRIVALSFGVVF